MPASRAQRPRVGVPSGESQHMAGSRARLPNPSVCQTPCTDGGWPVNIEVRLGTHALVTMRCSGKDTPRRAAC